MDLQPDDGAWRFSSGQGPIRPAGSRLVRLHPARYRPLRTLTAGFLLFAPAWAAPRTRSAAMIEAEWWEYDDAEEMADAVAGDVGFIVESALDARGSCLL